MEEALEQTNSSHNLFLDDIKTQIKELMFQQHNELTEMTLNNTSAINKNRTKNQNILNCIEGQITKERCDAISLTSDESSWENTSSAYEQRIIEIEISHKRFMSSLFSHEITKIKEKHDENKIKLLRVANNSETNIKILREEKEANMRGKLNDLERDRQAKLIHEGNKFGEVRSYYRSSV
jgi:hypothetical protein